MKPETKAALGGKNQIIMVFFAFSFGMILSNLLGNQLFQEPQSQNEEKVLISYRGEDKSLADLPEDIAEDYHALLAQTRQKKQLLLENAVLIWHVRQHARSKGLNEQAAMASLFGNTEVTEADVSAYYQENKDALDKPFFEVRDAIRAQLVRSRMIEARKRLLAALENSGNLAIFPED